MLTSYAAVNNKQLFNDVLLKINKELAYVQFELRACRNQYDGKVYYGVINNVADEQSKLGTKYSVPQIAFYKGVVCHCLLGILVVIYSCCCKMGMILCLLVFIE